ncbi:hypothetical protein DNTS_025977 [Danionella cerebrum]|uniref:Uncharacterized protein n=1 Tax=Danionella cerebrum TaxID=2873325 RepID=A0A553PVE0_9TELE|nr:hypothetical protein DNTS_025977 [Danionella translucida]
MGHLASLRILLRQYRTEHKDGPVFPQIPGCICLSGALVDLTADSIPSAHTCRLFMADSPAGLGSQAIHGFSSLRLPLPV